MRKSHTIFVHRKERINAHVRSQPFRGGHFGRTLPGRQSKFRFDGQLVAWPHAKPA